MKKERMKRVQSDVEKKGEEENREGVQKNEVVRKRR